MTKHIPTLQVVYYSDVDSYSYRYDDVNGNTQEVGVFPSLDMAMGDATRNLKCFTLLEGVEQG